MKYRIDKAKIVKSVITRYFPENSYRLLGRNFLVNRQDSAFGAFYNGHAKQLSPREYSRLAAQLYSELRETFHHGIHPRLADVQPKSSSWIPFVSGQTSAYILNFPSIHYHMNDPLVLGIRYVLYKNNEKFLDKSFTKVLLPNTTHCFSWPENDANKPEDNLVGRLIVNSYSPLYRNDEFRYFVVFKSDGLVRCGVHSWGSNKFGYYRIRHRFEFRNKTPTENEDEYRFFQEISSPLPCIAANSEPPKAPEITTRNGGPEAVRSAQVLGLADYSHLYSNGYFVGFDKKKKGNVLRIWHDNGSFLDNHPFPTSNGISDLNIETDFYVPAGDYYAKVVMAHPIAPGIAIGDEFKVAAYHQSENTPFLTRQIPVQDQVFGSTPGTHQFDLKAFFDDIRPMLRTPNEIVQITLSFKPRGSNFTIPSFEGIQAQVFLYSHSGIMCDQYHSAVSSSHLLNPASYSSPRTNKFSPFYADAFNSPYVIVNNKFPAYMSSKPGAENVNHKIRLTLYLNNELETATRYLTTSSKEKFYAIDIRQYFDLKEDKPYVGMVHLFSGTANFWCYFMNIGKKDGDISLMCDHLSGG